jgi:guanine nucleotide-exchange factor
MAEDERNDERNGVSEPPSPSPSTSSEAQVYRRPEAFPRANFIQNIEIIQKACGWRFDLRPISQGCATLLKAAKEQESFSLDVITGSDSLVLNTLLEATSSKYPPRVTEPALNLLHRLISSGLIVGESSGAHGPAGEKGGRSNEEKGMVDQVVERICDCGSSSSEDVQLAVLKALLTISTSETFCVKGERLLQAFKMIFNLAVGSNFEGMKRHAIASLQQLLSVWFRKAASDFNFSASPDTPRDEEDLSSSGHLVQNDLDVANIATLAEKADISGLEKVLTSRLTESQKTVVEAGGDGAAPKQEGGGEGGEEEEEAEKNDVRSSTTKPPKERAQPLCGLEADLFVLLRSLCRLAARTIEMATADYFVVDGKLLALGLIKHVLQFQAWDSLSRNFIHRARNLLCVMLIRNANCSINSAAIKQIEILNRAILQPRILAAMKPEAGAFIPLLIVRHLEVFSPEPHLLISSCKALCSLCGKDQLLADLFVNYDCEMNATNIFDRIVKGLCYVIVSKPTYDQATESEVKILACKALSKALTSLHDWFDRHQTAVASDANGGLDDTNSSEQISHLLKGQQDLLRAKNKKDSLCGGIDLFNANPVKGMKTLVNSGVVESSVEAQAEFLYKSENLDLTAKGQFLGHHGENQISVMHKYADYFDFAGIEFDDAMRLYLDTFRLPGEAQQIDRIMEKFADRYCTCNTDTFSNADQAYTLAYAIIMLNTDMHNPLAEHMMTKVAFIGMVNQCPVEVEEDEHQALPEEFLGAIFDRIASSQIKFKDEANEANPQIIDKTMTSPLLKVLRKALPIQKVFGDMGAQQSLPSLDGIKDILRKHQSRHESAAGIWNTAVNSDLAICMCEAVCKHSMEVFDSLDKIKVSMESFELIIGSIKEAIVLTGLMDQNDSCDKLISILSNLVGFGDANTFTLSLPDSMRIEAFKKLVQIAINQPDLIRGSWTHVFRCFSTAQYFALQGHEMEVMRKFDRLGYDMQYNNQSSKRSRLLSFFESEGLQLIDQIFSGSGNMDGQTIVMFVSAMCAVNREDLEGPKLNGLELILLQRLVETVHHNLNRIRMVWSRLWAVTSAHLVGAGCEDDVEIAMYSIDALRQIVFKLLEHQELSTFKFQNQAIKPFVSIFRQSELDQVHVFTIQCILQVVSAHNTKLQSGWTSILACVKSALGNESVEVVDAALHILKQSWFEPQIISSKELFNELKGCFIELMAHGSHVEHQGRAIEIVKEGISLLLDDLSEDNQGLEMIELLCNMGNTALKHNKSCYHVAYQALFSIFARDGLKYKDQKWEEILENLCRTSFIEGPAPEDVADEYYKTYFPLLCKLLNHTHVPIAAALPKIVEAIRALLAKNLTTELKIFLISQISLVALSLKERTEDESTWTVLVGNLKDMLLGLQNGLGNQGAGKACLANMTIAFQEALSETSKCLVAPSLRKVKIEILDVLELSVMFAIQYNNGLLTDDQSERDEAQGFLLRQEVSGGCLLIELANSLCTGMGADTGEGGGGKKKKKKRKADLHQGRKILLRVCSTILRETCLPRDASSPDDGLEANRAPLVALAVTSCSGIPEELLKEVSEFMLPQIVHYIESNHSDVRCAVSDFLLSKVKPALEVSARPRE